MEEVHIDWGAAEVRDGALKVPLEPEPDKRWREHLERTLRLLASEEAAEVTIRKHTLRVEHVDPEDPARLRHLLEGVVDQANAAVRAEEAREHSGESVDGPDARLTAAFRAFASGERGE